MKFFHVWDSKSISTVLNAETIVSRLEDGEIDLSFQISLTRNSPRHPIRKWLREIIYAAHNDNKTSNNLDKDPHDRFAIAFDDAPIGMALSDLSGRLIKVNYALCRLLKLSQEQLIGKPVSSLSPESSRQEEIALGNEIIAGKRRSFQIEKTFLRSDGVTFQALLGISILQNSSGEPVEVLAHVTDMTEQKRRQREKMLEQNMGSLSRLAGNIAHDFNNLLTSIISNVQLARDFDGELEDSLDGIEAAAHSAERMTQRLMTLNESTFAQKSPINVDACLEQMHKIFSGLVSDTIQFSLNLNAPDAWISVNPSQFEQALINLTINAVQAINNYGGMIEIKTSYTVHEGKKSIRIVIRDNGAGMSEKTLEKVFEPFFTTKSAHSNSGLGLSSVHAVIKKSDGTI